MTLSQGRFPGPVAPAASPFDVLQAGLTALWNEVLATLLAVPGAIVDTGQALARLPRADGARLIETLAVMAAVLAGYWITRRLLAPLRLRAGAHAVPFAALVRQAGCDLAALAVAALIGRVLLARWLGLPAGAPDLPALAAVALVRFLLGLGIARFFFQVEFPGLRLVAVDDAGASRALRWTVALLAAGHAHAVLLELARADGFPAASARALTVLVAAPLLAAALRLIADLRRRHRLPRPVAAIGAATASIIAGLWVWGALSGEFRLFHGMVGTVAILLVGWTLDQVIALSIEASRRPAEMRRLFVTRVVVDALAVALIARVLIEFWFADAPGWFEPGGFAVFSRRLTLASILLVGGLWICAMIHVWVQARLTPPEAAPASAEVTASRARLSTILPIVRFAAIAIILLIVGLMMLSIVGVDITPLMAGAGIVGLAVSLGSQTLVKDIVSGVFYMIDDVFRLGETIESNSRRGQLEHISARSVRLRDNDGRLHTIPFGDLGTVTNYSRRLARFRARVAFATTIEDATLAGFRQSLRAALRSDKLLQSGIIGTIATEAHADAARTAVEVSFVLGAGIAAQAEVVARRLIAEELREAGLAPDGDGIAITVEEISPSPPSAAAPHPPSPQAAPESATPSPPPP